MNKFYWLVKREFWEHRGGFLWTPVICASIIVLLLVMMLIGTEIGGDGFGQLWHHLVSASSSDLTDISKVLDMSALMPCFIVSIALFFVLFHYCAKSLSSDRNDRSILFWKSLPVSDLATVLSKVFSAVVVAPVIAVLVSTIGAMLVLLVLAATINMHGIGFVQAFGGLAHPLQILATLFGLLPIYMVWMLPTVGWVMLCSAWIRGNRAGGWAIGLPIGSGLIVYWLTAMTGHVSASSWYWDHVVFRLPFSVFPGSWNLLGPERGLGFLRVHAGDNLRIESEGLSSLFSQTLASQYSMLLTPDFLWGALAGAVMIALAVWLRRWRTEL